MRLTITSLKKTTRKAKTMSDMPEVIFVHPDIKEHRDEIRLSASGYPFQSATKYVRADKLDELRPVICEKLREHNACNGGEDYMAGQIVDAVKARLGGGG